MSFNNYKPDIAVVRNVTPTAEQIRQLSGLGLTEDIFLNSVYSGIGSNFVALLGGLKGYAVVPETAIIEEGLELESRLPTYPEYVESDAVFDTIDDLIEALKP